MKPAAYLLLPIGMLIGWIFGMLFQSSAPTDVGSAAAERDLSARANPAAAADPSTALRDAASVAAPAGAERVTEVSAAAIERSVRTALASAPRLRSASSARQAGSGTLRGQVARVDGAPLLGVQVRLAPLTADAQRLPQRVLGPAIQSAADSLADQARRLLDSESRALLGLSAADGGFAFEIEADRVYSIALHLPGWRFDRTDGQGSSVVAGANLVYVASPLANLELDLTDSAGQPLEAAVIAYAGVSRGNESWSFVAWSRAQPRLEFSPGSYRFIALSDDAEPWCPERHALWLAEQRSAVVELSLAASADARTERWQLAPRPTLFGRLLPAGQEPRTVGGYGLALVTPGQSNPEAIDFSDGYKYFETPHFLLTTETPGTYDLLLRWKGSEDSALLGPVELADGNLRRDFTAAPQAEHPRLFINASSPDGQPVDGFGPLTFSVRTPKGGTHTSQGYDNLLRIGPGRFELRVPAHLQARFFRPLIAPEEGGESSCQFEHSTWGRRTLRFVPGQTEYTLQLSAPATLTVSIGGATPAEPDRFYHVTIMDGSGRFDSMGGNNMQPVIGPGGVWSGTVKNLEPGSYDVHLQYNQGTRQEYTHETLMSLPVQIVPGENTVHFDLNTLSELRVRVSADSEGMVELEPRLARGRFGIGQKHAQIDEDGLAVFPKVSPGDYILSYGGQFMGVRCPTGEVQFTPNPANCLRVQIWDEDGSMFKAGLRSGDRITAVDGQTFELQAWLEAIAKKAPERTLSLSVLRDGASLQLAVPNRAFSGEDGGYCQPSFEP
jgi:hypothetical protein